MQSHDQHIVCFGRGTFGAANRQTHRFLAYNCCGLRGGTECINTGAQVLLVLAEQAGQPIELDQPLLPLT